MATASLSEIYLYPVKSLAGIRVKQWPVTDTGFRYDRKWMLVDQDHRFLSQRRLPKMALIKTAIVDETLVLTAPATEPLTVPLHGHSSETLTTVIWNDACSAYGVSKTADQWFSRFLETNCRLVYQAEQSPRRVDPRYARTSDQTAFSDGFPFLIISENSLVSLNRQMEHPLPMVRFRPNLVLSGCSAYAEDRWRSIRIGEIGFRLPKPCSRCVVTTIDPATGETGKEPLRTLNRTRKWKQQVFFGQNALHNNTGHLSVGDQLQVYSTGPAQPPLS